jgi:BirA family biotin operon repressor/biotin-[acetyl-CoA-carboxylase] ligase
VHLDDLVSTNATAFAQAAAGDPGGLWVVARQQTGGRGRSGRAWSSPPGNLYASLLLRPACSLATAQQLALLAPVTMFDCVSALTPDARARGLRLKWPNDVLIAGAKLSGVLVESSMASDGRLAVVVGIGINLASHPDAIDQAATDLAAQGIATTLEAAFEALAAAWSRWLDVWNDGAGFAAIRQAWIDRAGPIGEALSVRTGDGQRVEGHYRGLDHDGALLLADSGGGTMRFAFGQVALAGEGR